MNDELVYTVGDLWLAGALTAYLSVAAAYWLCAFFLDGPWRGSMHLWLLLNVLLWPTFPFYLAGRWVFRRISITRNTAKAPACPGAPVPAPRSGPEEPAAGGGGSSGGSAA